jgi:hypothetical protein
MSNQSKAMINPLFGRFNAGSKTVQERKNHVGTHEYETL